MIMTIDKDDDDNDYWNLFFYVAILKVCKAALFQLVK